MAFGPLPKAEIWIYSFVVVCTYINSAIDLYNVSLRVARTSSFLSFGWESVGRLKDSAGYEWDSWVHYIYKVWPWMCGHVVIGQLLYYADVRPQIKQFVLLIIDFIALSYCYGFTLNLFVAVQSMAVFVLAYVFRNKLVVYIVSTVLLISYQLSAQSTYIFSDMLGLKRSDVSFAFIFFFLTWSVLRYMAFNIEICRGRLSPSVLDLLSYVFYLPVAASGPLLPCQTFILQIKQPITKPSLSVYFQLFAKIARLLLWAFMLEYAIHYFYFRSLMYQRHLVENCEGNASCPWSLVLSNGLNFFVKYFVMYGIASTIARFDWLIPPQEPRCLVRVGSYTEVWRYFDVGFYRFIVDYIYIPIGGGSKSSTRQQLFSSLIVFAFIYIWHGLQFGILLWTLNSFLTVSLESIGRLVIRKPNVNKFLDTHLSPQWQTRLYGIPAAVLLALGHICGMCLVINPAIGMILMRRIILNGWPWLFPASVATMYCAVQVSVYLNSR